MKWEVFYTEQAETDLRNVFEYIAFTLLVPGTAKKQVQRIMKEIAALDSMPFRYKLYHKEPWKSRGLRTFSVDNFICRMKKKILFRSFVLCMADVI